MSLSCVPHHAGRHRRRACRAASTVARGPRSEHAARESAPGTQPSSASTLDEDERVVLSSTLPVQYLPSLVCMLARTFPATAAGPRARARSDARSSLRRSPASAARVLSVRSLAAASTLRGAPAASFVRPGLATAPRPARRCARPAGRAGLHLHRTVAFDGGAPSRPATRVPDPAHRAVYASSARRISPLFAPPVGVVAGHACPDGHVPAYVAVRARCLVYASPPSPARRRPSRPAPCGRRGRGQAPDAARRPSRHLRPAHGVLPRSSAWRWAFLRRRRGRERGSGPRSALRRRRAGP